MNLPKAFNTRRVKEALISLDQHVTKNRTQAKLLKILLELTEALIEGET
jgi:hypothetical protein